MNETIIKGVILNERISKHLLALQNNQAINLAALLDDSITFLLNSSSYYEDNPRGILDVLKTLHIARTEIMELVPNLSEGGAQ